MDQETKKLKEAQARIDVCKTDPLRNCNRLLDELSKSVPKSKQQHVCDCGAVIQPYDVAWGTVYPSQCRDCGLRVKEQALKASKRRRRWDKASRMRAAFEKAIPKHFHNAHIRHLPEPLRRMILATLADDSGRGLLLWGPVGSGKTYCLSAMGRWFAVRGETVVRLRFDRLLLNLRRGYSDAGAESEAAIVDRLTRADRLILEDVGSGASIDGQESDFAVRIMLLILDERLENGKPTYFSSNKTIELLEQSFDERIASRIQGCCEVVRLQGKDRRLVR